MLGSKIEEWEDYKGVQENLGADCGSSYTIMMHLSKFKTALKSVNFIIRKLYNISYFLKNSWKVISLLGINSETMRNIDKDFKYHIRTKKTSEDYISYDTFTQMNNK